MGRSETMRHVSYRSDCLLRSAGVPVDVLNDLKFSKVRFDKDCTLQTDFSESDYSEYEQAYVSAIGRIARETIVGEALAWQNPVMYEQNVRSLDSSVARKNRRRVDKMYAYISRYSAKNDTIGFFGPLCWGSVGKRAKSQFTSGETLLSERQVYLETWVTDAIAQALAQLPGIFPYLPIIVHGSFGVGEGNGSRHALAETHRLVLDHLDVDTRIGDLASQLEKKHSLSFENVALSIGELVSRGAVTCVPLSDVNEDGLEYLRRWVEGIGDPSVRASADTALSPFERLREKLSNARGNAAEVVEIQAELADQFSQFTSQESSRRPGEQYAGRSMVYEDTTRNHDFVLGEDYLDRWDQPMAILLRAANWYVNAVAEKFAQLAEEIYTDLEPSTKSGIITLERVFFLLSEKMAHGVRELPGFVEDCQLELQSKWAQFAEQSWDPDVTSDGLMDSAARIFPESTEPWPGAYTHSPDIQFFGGESAGGVRKIVLGELHVAINSLEQPAFLRFAPNLPRFEREELSMFPNGRVRFVPPRASRFVSSRLAPPGPVTEAGWLWWTWGRTVPSIKAPRLDARDVRVQRLPGREGLWVVGTTVSMPLMTVLGELLAMTVAGTFSVCSAGVDMPRVEVDGVVLSRQQWSIPTDSCSWANRKNRYSRYAEFLEWSRRYKLPEQFYWRVKASEKPQLVDQAIPASAERLASRVRGPDAEQICISEALPTTDDAWLVFNEQRYTAEARLVARLN